MRADGEDAVAALGSRPTKMTALESCPTESHATYELPSLIRLTPAGKG